MSGGRDEAATLADYAEDVRAAVKFLSQRKDVDPKRIAVVGHGEGGIVAMLAAAREKRIAALALVATTGRDGCGAQSGPGEACARSHQPVRQRTSRRRSICRKEFSRPS